MRKEQDQTVYQNVRLRKETHRKLRLLAAQTGESMIELIDRLLDEETKRKSAEAGGPSSQGKTR